MNLTDLFDELFDTVFNFFDTVYDDSLRKFISYEESIWNDEQLDFNNIILMYDFLDFLDLNYKPKKTLNYKYLMAKKIILQSFIREKLNEQAYD